MKLSKEVEKEHRQKFYETVSKALEAYAYAGHDSLNGTEYRLRRTKGEKLLKNYFGFGFAYISPSNPKTVDQSTRIKKETVSV